MSGTQIPPSTIGRKAWIALRFLLFGLPGIWLLTIFSLEFMAGLHPQGNASVISPLLSLPIALSGALMMLFAVGAWGRWAYLWVILSIPTALLLISTALPGDKGLGIGLAVTVTAFTTNAAVRAYYR